MKSIINKEEEKKLTIENLSPYLPYGLKVRYEGILNGREISAYKKQWEKENGGDGVFIDYSQYKEPEPIKGGKIGFLKEIHCNLKYTKYRIGNNGRQTHYNTDNFKPILHPLSDLTKEIEHNGERFVPMYKLIKTQGFSVGSVEGFEFSFHDEYQVVAMIKNKDWMLRYMADENAFFLNGLADYCKKHQKSRKQLQMFQMLFEWHFDVFSLIKEGLAIDINTL